jgi:hypothetical protein
MRLKNFGILFGKRRERGHSFKLSESYYLLRHPSWHTSAAT